MRYTRYESDRELPTRSLFPDVKEKGANIVSQRIEIRHASEPTTQGADGKDKSKETEDVGERTVGGQRLDVLELSPRGCK